MVIYIVTHVGIEYMKNDRRKKSERERELILIYLEAGIGNACAGQIRHVTEPLDTLPILTLSA